MKTKLYFILASIAGSVALSVACFACLLILKDILSGALTGKPETGWGIMIAILFAAPVIAVTAAISLFFWKLYKRQGKMPAYILGIVSLLLVPLVVGIVYWYNTKPVNPEIVSDSKTATKMQNASVAIKSYYKGAATQKTLPADLNQLKLDDVSGIDYRQITSSTYELCSVFARDTVTGRDFARADRETNLPERINSGGLLSSDEAFGSFWVHQQGKQCYSISLE